MATLTLHDVPDDLVVGLEQLALARGRSLDHQVIECLLSCSAPSFGMCF